MFSLNVPFVFSKRVIGGPPNCSIYIKSGDILPPRTCVSFARMLLIVCYFLVAAIASHAQAYINHSGNDVCSPGDSFTITLTMGLPYSNPIIWVNGQAHNGLSYTIQTTAADNPREYIYYGTVTLNTMGQQINWDSRVNGPARPGDLICIKTGVNSIAFPGSYSLYERFWTSADGTQNGHEVPDPAVNFTTGGFYPVSYQRSSAMQLQYNTIGLGQSNGVTVQYQVPLTLVDGPDRIWSTTTDWTSFSPGQSFSVTTPALPGYIYRHILQHQYYISVVFAYQPPVLGIRERRVVSTYDPINTAVLAVFIDPNTTFPNHHLYDQPTQPIETRPWYELMGCAIDHITVGGTVRTVTTEQDAMKRMTPDLYVYPNRPAGPSTSCLYNPSKIAQFYAYNLGSNSTHPNIRFDLYGMILNTNGDCQDFSAYLECQARCVGITNVQKIQLGTPFGTGFNYNPVMKCGTTTFQAGGFSFHRMTYWSTGGGIYDWAIAFPSGTAPGWQLSLGASQLQEYNALVVADSYSPLWSTPFAINNTDPVYGLPTLLGSYAD